MTEHSHRSHFPDDRRREELWETATSEVTVRATERYAQLARLLGLGPRTTRAFVSAAMEAARQYQTGCMYANYERRTGHPYPDEGRDNEDVIRATAWDMELTRLKATLEAEGR
jgi:ribosomal protein S12 methylthiotransferase accessory factor YcaO